MSTTIGANQREVFSDEAIVESNVWTYKEKGEKELSVLEDRERLELERHAKLKEFGLSEVFDKREYTAAFPNSVGSEIWVAYLEMGPKKLFTGKEPLILSEDESFDQDTFLYKAGQKAIDLAVVQGYSPQDIYDGMLNNLISGVGAEHERFFKPNMIVAEEMGNSEIASRLQFPFENGDGIISEVYDKKFNPVSADVPFFSTEEEQDDFRADLQVKIRNAEKRMDDVVIPMLGKAFNDPLVMDERRRVTQALMDVVEKSEVKFDDHSKSFESCVEKYTKSFNDYTKNLKLDIKPVENFESLKDYVDAPIPNVSIYNKDFNYNNDVSRGDKNYIPFNHFDEEEIRQDVLYNVVSNNKAEEFDKELKSFDFNKVCLDPIKTCSSAELYSRSTVPSVIDSTLLSLSNNMYNVDAKGPLTYELMDVLKKEDDLSSNALGGFSHQKTFELNGLLYEYAMKGTGVIDMANAVNTAKEQIALANYLNVRNKDVYVNRNISMNSFDGLFNPGNSDGYYDFVKNQDRSLVNDKSIMPITSPFLKELIAQDAKNILFSSQRGQQSRSDANFDELRTNPHSTTSVESEIPFVVKSVYSNEAVIEERAKLFVAHQADPRVPEKDINDWLKSVESNNVISRISPKELEVSIRDPFVSNISKNEGGVQNLERNVKMNIERIRKEAVKQEAQESTKISKEKETKLKL